GHAVTDGATQNSTARGSDGIASRRLGKGARLALVVVCLGVFLSALDQYVVVTTLEPISRDIGGSFATQPDRAFWIVNGYLLGYIVAMPLMGRISDVFGRRRIFALCLMFFALGSLLCALAPALGSPISPDYSTLSGAALTPLYSATH